MRRSVHSKKRHADVVMFAPRRQENDGAKDDSFISPRPKTVLIISSIFFPHVFGGAEIAAYNRARMLVRQGHKVHVLTLKEKDAPAAWGEMAAGGYRLYRVQPRRAYTLYGRHEPVSFVQKLLWHFQDYFDSKNKTLVGRVLDEVKPDHVEIDNIIGIGFNSLGEIQRRNIPVVYVLHDLNLACFNTGMIREGMNCQKKCGKCHVISKLRQQPLRKIKSLGFIAPSSAHLRQAHKYIPIVRQSPSCVVPNLPEDKPLYPVNRTKAAHMRVLYAGRLDRVKGIEMLLGVLSDLSRRYSFHLTVLGTGPLAESLQNKYSEAPWVSFRGFVSRDEVAAALQTHDLYCLPSLVSESYGLVTAQALQLGTPVVGSDAGGTAELVRDGITGRLVPPGQAQAWKAVFTDIFENPRQVAMWQENTRNLSYEFDEKHIGLTHDAFIESLYRQTSRSKTDEG